MELVVCLLFLSIRPWRRNENQGSWVIGSTAQLFCVQRQQYASTAALRPTWHMPQTCVGSGQAGSHAPGHGPPRAGSHLEAEEEHVSLVWKSMSLLPQSLPPQSWGRVTEPQPS